MCGCSLNQKKKKRGSIVEPGLLGKNQASWTEVSALNAHWVTLCQLYFTGCFDEEKWKEKVQCPFLTPEGKSTYKSNE